MQINLEANEVAALLNVLSSYIPQLREEIGKTENYNMREELKAQEQTLNSLISRLGGALQGNEGTNLGVKNPPW